MRYSVAVDPSAAPFHIEAELWYEPIGFRWARNLASYRGKEPQRMASYYNLLASRAAVMLARTDLY